ncbi:glycosyltransferase family 4 protein [Bryobacter aggregatus]|uniref:glycosyltransferase family 4 protein n=1 Tax=Bryobacter aggregatus TaxID=360054 RepID=UPI0004E0D69C|nr:glycosyltransferase family 4 protein [Bryobacter aggregatus]
MQVFAVIEANSVTGPAKNLIQFAAIARDFPNPIHFTFFTFRRPGDPSDDPFLRACRAASIPVELILENGPYDWRTIRRLQQWVRERRPALVQTHSIKSHFLYRLSGLWRERPWLAYHHGYTKPTRKAQIYNHLGAWGIGKCRMAITVTPAFRAELLGVGIPADRIEIIPNAIDPNWFPPALRRPMPAKPHLVSIGRLSREKAHADLIAALPAGCKLTIAGEGPEREALLSLAASRQADVQLIGQIEDVRPCFREADLFVLPSHSEGSPNILIEAMAAAIPIVATTAGGIPDTVTDGVHALLVPPAQPARLTAAIERLIADPPLAAQLAAQARARVVEHFSPMARAERMAALYRSLV